MATGVAQHTLLFVDDEPEILDGLRRSLRTEGYRILATTQPREALQLLEAGGIDLLVSDIDMPEMSGIELVRKVREAHPDVVRILLTGDASLESAMEAINLGEVHRYLTKPWTRDGLRATLREALGRLDELRRMASAERAAKAGERLLLELEREHPGIAAATFDGDHYVLSSERAEALLNKAAAYRAAIAPTAADTEVIER